MPVDDWDSDTLDFARRKYMIEDLKAIARNVGWQIIIVQGEPIQLALTAESNDIINDSHFRDRIITVEEFPKELELIASIICKRDNDIIAAAGVYGGKEWGVKLND